MSEPLTFLQLAATCLLARTACVLLHVFEHRGPHASFAATVPLFSRVLLASFCTFSSTVDLTRRLAHHVHTTLSVTLKPPLSVPCSTQVRRFSVLERIIDFSQTCSHLSCVLLASFCTFSSTKKIYARPFTNAACSPSRKDTSKKIRRGGRNRQIPSDNNAFSFMD